MNCGQSRTGCGILCNKVWDDWPGRSHLRHLDSYHFVDLLLESLLHAPVTEARAIDGKLFRVAAGHEVVEECPVDEDVVVDDEVEVGSREAGIQPLGDILPHLLRARHICVRLEDNDLWARRAAQRDVKSAARAIGGTSHHMLRADICRESTQ